MFSNRPYDLSYINLIELFADDVVLQLGVREKGFGCQREPPTSHCVRTWSGIAAVPNVLAAPLHSCTSSSFTRLLQVNLASIIKFKFRFVHIFVSVDSFAWLCSYCNRDHLGHYTRERMLCDIRNRKFVPFQCSDAVLDWNAFLGCKGLLANISNTFSSKPEKKNLHF